jgi:Predicted membrane protein
MTMTKRRNNTQSANLTLGGITLGFLLSYPFHSGFVGGLISSGCSAGMIGGLADWFAVTALFRRPLGIRPGKIVRTEIIPQNRERIFAALADMVQNELLSQDVLRRKLSEWDFSSILIRILKEKDVQESVAQMLVNLVGDIVNQPEPAEFKEQVLNLCQEHLDSINISQTLAELIQFSLKHGDVDRLLSALCQVILEFTDQPEVNTALESMMEAALIRYAGNNPTRKMVGKFLPSPSVLAQGLRAKGKAMLQDGTVEHWLRDSLFRFVLELRTKSSLQESLNLNLIKALEESFRNPQLREKIKALLGIGNENRPVLNERLMARLNKNWTLYLTEFEQNLNFRHELDKGVKGFLEKQIGYHHTAIGRMVREGLEPLTNEKLVELIEEKAGNDLQMIRINGSVVGGLVGMLLYVFGVVLR